MKKSLPKPMDDLKRTAVRNFGLSVHNELKSRGKTFIDLCREMNKGYSPDNMSKIKAKGSASTGIILDICEYLNWNREDYFPNDIWNTIEHSKQRKELPQPELVTLTLEDITLERVRSPQCEEFNEIVKAHNILGQLLNRYIEKWFKEEWNLKENKQ